MRHLHALIPAAGTGSRFGETLPKQYHPLLGRPMLFHAIATLAGHPRIEYVAIALAQQDRWFEQYDWSATSAKLRILRCGGASRAQTVLNALEALSGEIEPEDWILVHDAARPCLSAALLGKLIDELDSDAVGGLLALPATDTLKRADAHNRVARTLTREGVWQAQTPQMFRYAVLLRALNTLQPERATDEAAAVESLGLKPRLVESSAENVKVTVREDLKLAEAILRARAGKTD